MRQISSTPLPAHSRLWSRVQSGDFIDGYAVDSALSPRAAADIGFTMPGWTKALMNLRNTLMKPFGLKTESSETGDGAIFPVEYEGEDELIIGTDDRHLDFRICLMQKDGRLHMATWVHRNNAFGTAYLALIKPFHVLIARNTMRRIARVASGPTAE